ncbi:hypothetical protein SCOR_31630 [Sulfidibacter corallicola]|uniref:Uncharacterized protein n=1 Tax=Sulfidibacter corallicola TaxID=2818388 RepID=A0A8A4TK25_SULCO|nr:hypothetical protein [Sulfidibacter corallicola]QTD49900.1 hypothetical protein J3U87_30325 [Sulfidibacter corallicola]
MRYAFVILGILILVVGSLLVVRSDTSADLLSSPKPAHSGTPLDAKLTVPQPVPSELIYFVDKDGTWRCHQGEETHSLRITREDAPHYFQSGDHLILFDPAGMGDFLIYRSYELIRKVNPGLSGDFAFAHWKHEVLFVGSLNTEELLLYCYDTVQQHLLSRKYPLTIVQYEYCLKALRPLVTDNQLKLWVPAIQQVMVLDYQLELLEQYPVQPNYHWKNPKELIDTLTETPEEDRAANIRLGVQHDGTVVKFAPSIYMKVRDEEWITYAAYEIRGHRNKPMVFRNKTYLMKLRDGLLVEERWIDDLILRGHVGQRFLAQIHSDEEERTRMWAIRL